MLCQVLGTCLALQAATVGVAVQGRCWQQPWHRALAGLLGEVGLWGTLGLEQAG